MKPPRLILALSAFFVLAAGVAGCGSAVPGDAVAVVAGNPVSTNAFNHWMYVAAKGNSSSGGPVIVPTDPPGFAKCIAQAKKAIPSVAKQTDSQVKSECKQLFTSLSGQVLDFLIRSYWYQGDAAKQHIKITDQQVQDAFQTAKKKAYPTDAQFNAFLTQSGQTLPDILFRVRINQIYKKLIAQHSTTVTDAQVAAYYQSHMSQFGSPETRNIRLVLTKTAGQANAAKAALSAGQGKNFDAVAKKYSIDASTKNKGGLLAGVAKGQQDAALDQAAFSAPLGKILGPVKGQFGYYVFEVTIIKKGTQESLAKATPQIKALLTSQGQSTAQSAIDSAAKKNWLNQTECRSGFAMQDCKGFKAPSTTSTPTVAPSTSSSTPRTTTTK
jgi:foldase protein PrsA